MKKELGACLRDGHVADSSGIGQIRVFSAIGNYSEIVSEFAAHAKFPTICCRIYFPFCLRKYCTHAIARQISAAAKQIVENSPGVRG